MQRLFQPGPHQPGQLDLEKLIQSVFYNALVGEIYDGGQFTQQNLGEKIVIGVAITLRRILMRSEKCDGIRLTADTVITMQNCPEKYKLLFGQLIELKAGELSDSQLEQFALQVVRLDSFREIDPSQFLLESAGYVKPALRHIQYDESGVTTDLIRKSFYNEMVPQALLAVENQWLTYSDIEDQESQIYLALPALTILEALKQSKNCDGIRLLDNKVLTQNNCPDEENFPMLTRLILSIKDTVKKLSDDEICVVKHVLSCDRPLPEHLQKSQTPRLMESVAVIKDMAIEISRKQFFNAMIAKVLNFCCETLRPQSKGLAW